MMEGKKGVVFGVANERSIAAGITQALLQHRASVILTYPSEILKKRVDALAKMHKIEHTLFCDAQDESSIITLFKQVEEIYGQIDFVVHSIAYSDKDELRGRYISTSKSNFLNSMDVSCYSLTSIARYAEPLMGAGGSILTLSYYGAEKVMPHYNVMGVCKAALEASVRYLAVDMGGNKIRVNAISAGPIKTLSAAGIGDFSYIMKWNQYNSPLKRNVSLSEISQAALFLLSDMSTAITGEVLHVDSGYHVVGMKSIDAPDLTLKEEIK